MRSLLKSGHFAIGAFQSSISLQILTKDSVTVFVNAIMYYKVKDATSAVANVDDYSGSAQLLAATTLRNVLGTRQGKVGEGEGFHSSTQEPWGHPI